MLRSRSPAPAVVSRTLLTRGPDEARVWDELAAGLNLRRALRPNVEAITHYAFTEMLNNAIEHSEADRGSIRGRSRSRSTTPASERFTRSLPSSTSMDDHA
jgi:hypothetical protein